MDDDMTRGGADGTGAELLSAYLDGLLTPPERELFEKRLEADPDLREALELLTGAREALDFEAEPPAELVSGVMDRVNGELRRRKSAGRGRIIALFGSLAAAAVLAVAIFPKTADNKSGGAMSPESMSGDAAMCEDIAPYTMEPRDGDYATASLQPGAAGIGIPDSDDQALPDPESYCAGIGAAAARFDELPEEVMDGCLRTVELEGCTGYVITPELLEQVKDLAVSVTYPQGQWDCAVAYATAG